MSSRSYWTAGLLVAGVAAGFLWAPAGQRAVQQAVARVADALPSVASRRVRVRIEPPAYSGQAGRNARFASPHRGARRQPDHVRPHWPWTGTVREAPCRCTDRCARERLFRGREPTARTGGHPADPFERRARIAPVGADRGTRQGPVPGDWRPDRPGHDLMRPTIWRSRASNCVTPRCREQASSSSSSRAPCPCGCSGRHRASGGPRASWRSVRCGWGQAIRSSIAPSRRTAGRARPGRRRPTPTSSRSPARDRWRSKASTCRLNSSATRCRSR